MKLDKIAFARLVAFIAFNKDNDHIDVYELDDLIDVPVPEVKAGQVPAADVDQLLALMAEGTRKIEAIKMYRQLTGAYLKESNDAVERHWVSKPIHIDHEDRD